MIDVKALVRMTGRPTNENMRQIITGLQVTEIDSGLERPHRLAHYLAQLAHETMGFHYDREVWGPTAAQKRYEGRADLGNTQPGDGFLFRGRTPVQITGRSNYGEFRDWCRSHGMDAPDFVQEPDAVLDDPWEGLAPIWYWTTRNLNALADRNDILSITRHINGGTNGYDSRLAWYTRAALVLCGYDRDDVRGFQDVHGLDVDGISGPKTRAALHLVLCDLPSLKEKRPRIWGWIANFW